MKPILHPLGPRQGVEPRGHRRRQRTGEGFAPPIAKRRTRMVGREVEDRQFARQFDQPIGAIPRDLVAAGGQSGLFLKREVPGLAAQGRQGIAGV